jgi:hypothetical protein
MEPREKTKAAMRENRCFRELIDSVFVLDVIGTTVPVLEAMREWAIDKSWEVDLGNRTANELWGAIIYRGPATIHCDWNAPFQLTNSQESLVKYMEVVTPDEGRGGQRDLVGACDMALHRISWQNGRKRIYWIAGTHARGRTFSGDAEDAHNDQEAPLERLVLETARAAIDSIATSVETGGRTRKLSEIETIHRGVAGSGFEVKEFFFL